MRVFLVGANGMLGATLFRYLGGDDAIHLCGSMRGDPSRSTIASLPRGPNTKLLGGLSGPDSEQFAQAVADFSPDVIVNCVGWRRRPQNVAETAEMIAANSLWPHRLAALAAQKGARMVHFSTDGVFSGRRGHYREADTPDPVDAYGCSKWLGEPDYRHCLTLRTSMIGHAFFESDQLVDWLVRQKGAIHGYRNAIFSGLPTIEIANIVKTIVLPRVELSGVWHLASAPISKFDLIEMIAERYELHVEVAAVDEPVIDRSLDPTRFRETTGYIAPPWPELVDRMHRSR